MTARNPGLNLPPCQPELYDHGEHVITVLGAAEDIEAWVKQVARMSGQPVDWHYVGGRGVVLALGDLTKVSAALPECSKVLVGQGTVPEFYSVLSEDPER